MGSGRLQKQRQQQPGMPRDGDSGQMRAHLNLARLADSVGVLFPRPVLMCHCFVQSMMRIITSNTDHKTQTAEVVGSRLTLFIPRPRASTTSYLCRHLRIEAKKNIPMQIVSRQLDLHQLVLTLPSQITPLDRDIANIHGPLCQADPCWIHYRSRDDGQAITEQERRRADRRWQRGQR